MTAPVPVSTPTKPVPARIVAALKLPLPVEHLARLAVELEATHGPDLTMTQFGTYFLIATPGDPNPASCWCHHCEDARLEALPADDVFAHPARFMILCPTCGNKRCPHANHHDQACTGSNNPGQVGSAYPA